MSFNRSKNREGNNSFDAILAYMNDGEHSNLSMKDRYSVNFRSYDNMRDTLLSSDEGFYQHSAGGSLSSIFAPYKSAFNDSDMPSFREPDNGDDINLLDLLPFRWTQSNTVVDTFDTDNVDSFSNIVSHSGHVSNIHRYRNNSNVRGVGLRLPLMGVGWGYTLEGLPFPNDGSNEELFVGGYENGFQVDPKDYVAAPIDLRYDEERGVWTCLGGDTNRAILIRLTGTHSSIGDHRWSYQWVEVRPTVGGGYTTFSGNRNHNSDGLAYNRLEANNNGEGWESGWINWDKIDELDSTIRPASIGQPVVEARLEAIGSGFEIRFSFQNPVEIDCPEEGSG